MRQMILAHPQNGLEKELLNIFHCSNMPMHFNKTGNKEFNNYQRISIIILLRRSGKSIRQFIDGNAKKVPQKEKG